jgi:hypothetical protein
MNYTVAKGVRVFAEAHKYSINVGRVSVVEAMKVPVEAERVLIKAVRVPIDLKVLLNFLLQAKRVLVDCRGLESALEAVRVSIEAVRVLI